MFGDTAQREAFFNDCPWTGCKIQILSIQSNHRNLIEESAHSQTYQTFFFFSFFKSQDNWISKCHLYTLQLKKNSRLFRLKLVVENVHFSRFNKSKVGRSLYFKATKTCIQKALWKGDISWRALLYSTW